MSLVGGKGAAMADIVQTLAHLLDHGWIPLGSLAHLLDIAPETVYARKRENLPNTIRVGSIERIYHDDLIKWLKCYPRKRTKSAHVRAVLAFYNTMRNQRAREHQTGDPLYLHDSDNPRI